MIVYDVVCMLITFFAIEYYIAKGVHSSEQRLLPLVLGLIGVYDFYQIVEYMTKANDVFYLLKELLLIQLILLVFYYVLDFTQYKMHTWGYIVIFSILTLENIFVIVRFYYSSSVDKIVNIGITFVSVVTIIYATYSLVVNTFRKKIHRVYGILYLAMLLPFTALFLHGLGLVNQKYTMPGTFAFFCIIIVGLMKEGVFSETARYLKEDMFNTFNGYIILLGSSFEYVDASNRTKEKFPELIENCQKNPMDFIARDQLIEWANSKEDAFQMEYRGIYFKTEVITVRRNNKINGYIYSFTDITEEIDKLHDARLESKQKSSFLANMSHELRSPLHAIIGGADIVLANGELSTKNVQMVRQIKKSGNQLLEKVNSILDYSKMEAHKLDLVEREYNFRDLIENLEYNYLLLLKEKDVKLSVEFDSKIPRTVLGDEGRVRMMISNLLSNAVKFTNEGYITCNISVEETEANYYFTVVVKDTGLGIPTNEIANIFEEYESAADADSDIEGTGLGLPLIKRLSLLMGGDVSVLSDGSSGSEFTLNFAQKKTEDTSFYDPFILDENSLTIATDDEVIVADPEWIYPEAKVLVVDDMEVNRQIFIGMTLPWQIQVQEAENGRSAVEMARENHYDLIILDQMMPGLSGVETGRLIKEFSDSPVVIFSANISDRLIEVCNKEGFAKYIAKPVGPAELKLMLEELLPVNLRKSYINSDFSTAIVKDDIYRMTLEAYVEELEELIPELEATRENDLDNYRIKVHGIKGVSRQLGRERLGDCAEIMEMAAKSEHIDFITNHFGAFIDEISITIANAKKELEG